MKYLATVGDSFWAGMRVIRPQYVGSLVSPSLVSEHLSRQSALPQICNYQFAIAIFLQLQWGCLQGRMCYYILEWSVWWFSYFSSRFTVSYLVFLIRGVGINWYAVITWHTMRKINVIHMNLTMNYNVLADDYQFSMEWTSSTSSCN